MPPLCSSLQGLSLCDHLPMGRDGGMEFQEVSVQSVSFRRRCQAGFASSDTTSLATFIDTNCSWRGQSTSECVRV